MRVKKEFSFKRKNYNYKESNFLNLMNYNEDQLQMVFLGVRI